MAAHICASVPAPERKRIEPRPASAADAVRRVERDRERKELWRAENRDHYNAKQREYQRAYRARKKAEGEKQ